MPVQLGHSYGIQAYVHDGNPEPPRKTALLRLSKDALASIAAGAKVQVEYDGNGVPVLNVDGQRHALRSLPEPSHHELHVRVCPQGPKARTAPFLQYGTVKSKLIVDPTLLLPPPIGIPEPIKEPVKNQTSPFLTPAEAAIAAVSEATHREREERKKGQIVMLDEPPVPSPTTAAGGKRRPGSGTKRPPTASSSGSLASRVASPVPGRSTPTATPAPIPAKKDHTLEGRMFRMLAQRGSMKEADIMKALAGSTTVDGSMRREILGKLKEMAQMTVKSGTSKTPDMWELRKSAWLNARPFEVEGVPDGERERLAQRVAAKLREMGVPQSDPVWKELRPPTPPLPLPTQAARSPRPPVARSSTPITTAPAGLKTAKVKDKDREPVKEKEKIAKKLASTRPNPSLPPRPSESVIRKAEERKEKKEPRKRELERPIEAKNEGARALKEREAASTVMKSKDKEPRARSPAVPNTANVGSGRSTIPASNSLDVNKVKPTIPARDSAPSTLPSQAVGGIPTTKRPRESDALSSSRKAPSSSSSSLQRDRNVVSPQPGTSRPRPTHTRDPPSITSLADIVPDPKYLPNEAIKGKIPRRPREEEEEGEIEDPASSKRRRVEAEREAERDRRDRDRDQEREGDRGRDRGRDWERDRDHEADRSWDRDGSRRDRDRARDRDRDYDEDSHRQPRRESPSDQKRPYKQEMMSSAEIRQSIEAARKQKEAQRAATKRSESPPSKMDQLASKKVKRETSPAGAPMATSKSKEKLQPAAVAKVKAESVEPPPRAKEKEKKAALRDDSPMALSERTTSSRATTKLPKRPSPVYTSSSEDEDDKRGRSPPKARKLVNGTNPATAAKVNHDTTRPSLKDIRAAYRKNFRAYSATRTELENEKAKLLDLLDAFEGRDDADSGISLASDEELMDADDLHALREKFDRLNGGLLEIQRKAEDMEE